MSKEINLAAAKATVLVEAGDDACIPFIVRATDTTGWNIEFLIFRASPSGDGECGDSIGAGNVTNTPGTPDSSLVLKISRTITVAYPRESLFGRLRYNYDDSVRTLLELLIQVQ